MNRIYNLQICRVEKPNYKNYDGIQKLPSSVDLRQKCPPIYDQGNLGSSVANVLCSAYSFDNLTFEGSRLFVYYNEKTLNGLNNGENNKPDVQSSIEHGINALGKYGICDEKFWQYNTSKFATTPQIDAYTNAKSHEIISNEPLNIKQDLNNIKACLAEGLPICLGIKVYTQFDSDIASKTGLIFMPSSKVLGGHAILIVGYDDEKYSFIFRNSFGTSWGENGYGYIGYDYITNPDQTTDLWVIRKKNEILPEPKRKRQPERKKKKIIPPVQPIISTQQTSTDKQETSTDKQQTVEEKIPIMVEKTPQIEQKLSMIQIKEQQTTNVPIIPQSQYYVQQYIMHLPFRSIPHPPPQNDYSTVPQIQNVQTEKQSKYIFGKRNW